MDTFTFFSHIFDSIETVDLSTESSQSRSQQSSDFDPPIDQERYDAGNPGAFCVIA